ncbi:MAG: alpha-E domain-containing protein [Pseudomonadales bacterium]|jgi:uncharacterized alpha-E superfamily protein|nr:alpha-E domain-containing protein [Pseudomonadales bacterium]
MLARVAENMYWMSRYVERAENMARLVNVNSNLLLDLPKGIAPGWRPLVTIIGGDEAYAEKYGDAEEEARVLRFLIVDRDNAQSIHSSVARARENARTFRDVIPREAWQEVNALYHFTRENMQQGLTKRGRFDFLASVIRRSQTLVGLLSGCMNHDDGYSFIHLGRHVERADMTTRILDVRSASLVPGDVAELRPFDNIQWMSVLKSLTGYQMYRLEMQTRVQRSEVLRFLLQSEAFPRAVLRCLVELERRLARLGPTNEVPLRVVHRLQRALHEADVEALSRERLGGFIDEMQIGLADVHTAIDEAFFRRQRPLAA